MKRFLVLLVVACVSAHFAFGQDAKNENNQFPKYQKVIEVEGKSKSEIYAQLKTWIAITFRSANDVIQLDDAENGKIIIRCMYKTSYKMMGTHSVRIFNTTTFVIKDNKFRCTIDISDVHVGTGTQSAYNGLIKTPNKKAYKPVGESVDKKIDSVFEILANLDAQADDDDDW